MTVYFVLIRLLVAQASLAILLLLLCLTDSWNKRKFETANGRLVMGIVLFNMIYELALLGYGIKALGSDLNANYLNATIQFGLFGMVLLESFLAAAVYQLAKNRKSFLRQWEFRVFAYGLTFLFVATIVYEVLQYEFCNNPTQSITKPCSSHYTDLSNSAFAVLMTGGFVTIYLAFSEVRRQQRELSAVYDPNIHSRLDFDRKKSLLNVKYALLEEQLSPIRGYPGVFGVFGLAVLTTIILEYVDTTTTVRLALRIQTFFSWKGIAVAILYFLKEGQNLQLIPRMKPKEVKFQTVPEFAPSVHTSMYGTPTTVASISPYDTPRPGRPGSTMDTVDEFQTDYELMSDESLVDNDRKSLMTGESTGIC